MAEPHRERNVSPAAPLRLGLTRHRPTARPLKTLVAGCLLGLFALQTAAQDEPPQAPVPSGAAGLYVDGRPVGNIGFTLLGDGPRFALAPVAAALGVELRIGPLGDSHTLVLEDKRILLGPDEPSVVTVAPDGVRREEIARLAVAPIQSLQGLQVPLELLRLTLGDELGYEVEWSFQSLELRFQRRELRQLEGAVSLLHQFRISTVEIELSARPRYRVERLPGALEIRFLGDSLSLREPPPRSEDPLVRRIVASPGRLRIELADDATAAEPRLVSGDVVRLVVDVYRQRQRQAEGVDEPRTVGGSGAGLRTIVLDPGHGGEETGAVGPSGTIEAELAMLVARMLRTRLLQRLPVRVVLTRDGNVDVPLDRRVAIANENKADLFVSIHFNSYFGSKARGAETYFLSREASDQLAARSAETENRSMSEAERQELADLELILWDLAQSFHLAESQRFASLVQEELNLALGLRNRGVRQAPFRVLMGADMPAVLVELGFLSNPEEEAKLQTPAYLGELVDSLVRAITRFKTQMEARQAGDPASAVSGGGS